MKEIEDVGEYSIQNLEGPKVNRENFESYVTKTKPRLIILHGHGSKDAVFGQNYEVILDKDNISLLNSTITYAVACDSSEQLGEIAINTGNADSYVGYEGEFMVVMDPSRSSTPEKDKNLKIFIQPYATLVLSLVAGKTVNDAITETKEVLRSLIRQYGVYGIKDSYGDAPLIRFALYWDLVFLKGYGDLDSKV